MTFFSSKENMCQDTCQVSTFCCGCADLRKGALIIGSVCLAFALIQVAYTGFLLVALHKLPDGTIPGVTSDNVLLVYVILGIFEVTCIVRVVVNILLILAAKKPGEGTGHTLPWLIATAIGIVIGALAILGGSYTTILDVLLNIYFFFVINSYRTELKGHITVSFPGQEPVTV